MIDNVSASVFACVYVTRWLFTTASASGRVAETLSTQVLCNDTFPASRNRFWDRRESCEKNYFASESFPEREARFEKRERTIIRRSRERKRATFQLTFLDTRDLKSAVRRNALLAQERARTRENAIAGERGEVAPRSVRPWNLMQVSRDLCITQARVPRRRSIKIHVIVWRDVLREAQANRSHVRRFDTLRRVTWIRSRWTIAGPISIERKAMTRSKFNLSIIMRDDY